MDIKKVFKSTQEQAIASWINYLNQLRLDELLSKLATQDINSKDSFLELQKLKTFIQSPENILGSDLTKHGEIAEYTQVCISNARKLIEGLDPEYTFETVKRTASEDYLRNGVKIQSKFYSGDLGNKTINAIKSHMKKYPDFIQNGGEYEIPKDQFEKIISILSKPASQLNRSENTLVKSIKEWEDANNVKFTNKIKPAIINYKDVQQATINDTINEEKNNLKNTDQKKRNQAYLESKPSLQQALQVTTVSAAIEGGMNFSLCVAKKLKSGKKINSFTMQDWKKTGIDTTKGAMKGALRGASIYSLTNFTATPAPVASALVTSAFGMITQSYQLQKGLISREDFIVNSEIVCLEVAISTISSVMGQIFIPIPVLSTIIGNTVGMFMYNISEEYLSNKEKKLIASFNENINQINQQLEKQYQYFIKTLKQEFNKFSSMIELAFDSNINIAFNKSIKLADYIGVDTHKILKNKKEIDRFFLN